MGCCNNKEKATGFQRRPPTIEKRKGESRGTPGDEPDIPAMKPKEILESFGCSESRMRLLFEGKNLDSIQ